MQDWGRNWNLPFGLLLLYMFVSEMCFFFSLIYGGSGWLDVVLHHGFLALLPSGSSVLVSRLPKKQTVQQARFLLFEPKTFAGFQTESVMWSSVLVLCRSDQSGQRQKKFWGLSVTELLSLSVSVWIWENYFKQNRNRDVCESKPEDEEQLFQNGPLWTRRKIPSSEGTTALLLSGDNKIKPVSSRIPGLWNN